MFSFYFTWWINNSLYFCFLLFYPILVYFIRNRNNLEMYVYIEKKRDIETERDIVTMKHSHRET